MTTVTIDRKILEDLIGMVEAETDRHRNRRGSAIKAGIASRDAIVAKAKEALGPREVQYTAYAEGR